MRVVNVIYVALQSFGLVRGQNFPKRVHKLFKKISWSYFRCPLRLEKLQYTFALFDIHLLLLYSSSSTSYY